MIPSFDKHDRIRFGNPVGDNDDGTTREAFTDILGVVTDPTTVTLKILKPSATTLTYNWPLIGLGDGLLTKAATGRFYVDVTLDEAGDWRWQLSGTGAVTTSEEGSLHCRWSPFA